MAIADDLTLGNVHLRNVPFAVLDIGAGNERIRHMVGRISLIIGQPLLRQYGRYTIDLTNRTLYLYRHSARRLCVATPTWMVPSMPRLRRTGTVCL